MFVNNAKTKLWFSESVLHLVELDLFTGYRILDHFVFWNFGSSKVVLRISGETKIWQKVWHILKAYFGLLMKWGFSFRTGEFEMLNIIYNSTSIHIGFSVSLLFLFELILFISKSSKETWSTQKHSVWQQHDLVPLYNSCRWTEHARNRTWTTRLAHQRSYQ